MLDLKKMKMRLNPILYNTYLLCFIGILASIDIIYLVIQNDITTVSVFILVSIISYFFSKNMTVILFLALTVANIYKYSNSVNVEGLENMEESDDMEVVENMEETEKHEEDEENMEESEENMEESDEIEDVENTEEKPIDPFEEQKMIRKNMEDFLDTQDKILGGIKDMEPLIEKAESFITKFEKYQHRNKNKKD